MFFILIGLFGACSEENSNNSLIAGFSFGFSLMISIASLGQIRSEMKIDDFSITFIDVSVVDISILLLHLAYSLQEVLK